MTTLKLGKPPTLSEALAEILRVAALVGGVKARGWAREVGEMKSKLAEGSRWGPRGVTWPLEAARLKLAADVAEHGYRRRAALDRAQSIADKLPGLARKAVDDADALEVEILKLDLTAAVAAEAEQVRLDPRTGKA